jgi:hypothetical protein
MRSSVERTEIAERIRKLLNVVRKPTNFFFTFRRTVFRKQCRGLPLYYADTFYWYLSTVRRQRNVLVCSPFPALGRRKWGKTLNYGSSIFDPSSRANASTGSALFARVEAVLH